MTWSIVARDPHSGAFGVVVATRFFAVGALCPHAMAGVGAIATQALVNPRYGTLGLQRLRDGASAAEVVEALIAADPGASARQLHVVDAQGRTAAHTGTGTLPWCGHRLGDGFSVAGNMLEGESVLDAAYSAYGAALAADAPDAAGTHGTQSSHGAAGTTDIADAPSAFARRLLDAMDAGEAQGGDRRGKQSAAILIHTTEDYPYLSLRVDDHPEPLQELRRLYQVSLGRFAAFRDCFPTRDNPGGTWDRSVIEAAVQRREALLAKRDT
jgi:uncharacterized Ntn-hydrolase superfamily protein